MFSQCSISVLSLYKIYSPHIYFGVMLTFSFLVSLMASGNHWRCSFAPWPRRSSEIGRRFWWSSAAPIERLADPGCRGVAPVFDGSFRRKCWMEHVGTQRGYWWNEELFLDFQRSGMILKLKKLKSLMILMPEMIRAVRERIFRSIFLGPGICLLEGAVIYNLRWQAAYSHVHKGY